MLRGWSHGKEEQIPGGGSGASGEAGVRAADVARVGVGGAHVDRGEGRLHRRDASEVGTADAA